VSSYTSNSRRSKQRRKGRRKRGDFNNILHIDTVKPLPIQTNVSPDPFWVTYSKNKPKIRSILEEYEIRGADTDALYHHMRKYDHDNIMVYDEYIMEETLKYVGDTLAPDALLAPIELSEVDYTSNTSPGWYYRQRGYRSKDDSYEEALDDARVAMDKIHKGQRIRSRPFVAGGRARLVSSAASAKKGRMIQAQDFRDFLITASYAQPMTEHLLSVPEISVGYSHFNLGYDKMFREMQENVWATDYSSYDAGQRNTLLGFALRILFSCFKRDPNHTNLEQFVIDSVQVRDVIMPDGRMFAVFTGLPSGHSMTSILNSITNFIIIQYTFRKLLFDSGLPTVEAEFIKTRVLGDDALISGELDFDFAQYSQIVHSTFGISVSPLSEKSKIYLEGEDYSLYPTYLGKKPTKVGRYYMPTRDAEETVAIAVWPEQLVEMPGQSYEIAIGLLIDNYYNIEARTEILDYLSWLCDNYNFNIPETSKFTRTFVFGDFTGSMKLLHPSETTCQKIELLYL